MAKLNSSHQLSISVDNEALFEQIANALTKDGFYVIENGLPEALAEQLLSQYHQTADEAFFEASTGRGSSFKQDKMVRRDKIHWIDESTDAGKQWFDWTSQLMTHVNQRLFLGLFSFESHYAHYSQGDFYKKHLDAFKGKSNRTLSLVTYLNKDWQKQDGGELVIYSPETDAPLQSVLPKLGTLVIFLSEEFPHEVLPANKERISIAGWFRVNSGQ